MSVKLYNFKITKIQIKDTTGGSLDFSNTVLNINVDTIMEFKQRLYDHCIALIDREVIAQMNEDGVTTFIYNPDSEKPELSRLDEFVLLYVKNGTNSNGTAKFKVIKVESEAQLRNFSVASQEPPRIVVLKYGPVITSQAKLRQFLDSYNANNDFCN
jgi:hypothetical protein